MKETDFTRQVCNEWACRGWMIVVNQAGMTVSNIPDRTLICPLGTIYIEFKGPRTKIRTGQKVWMERANRNASYAAIVVRWNGEGVTIQEPNGAVLMKLDIEPHKNNADAVVLAEAIFRIQKGARRA